MGRTTGMTNTEKDQVISLLAVSDDNYVPTTPFSFLGAT